MRAIAFILALALAPAGATAQETATLLADVVRIDGNDRLVAEGDVQVAYDGALLTARRVIYDRGAETLTIDGPITLDDGDRSVLVADAATMDADLRNGILTSARLVLDRQLQLAASQIARVGGRYTQLSNTVASSCEICAANPTPVWEIRAAKVIHDKQERLLYFDRATFRLFGLPIAYFPRLRLPDPDRPRATGVLIPRLRSNSQLGFGAKVPFFATLGDHADLTVTPYLATKTTTLETRYRQALSFGAINIDGAISRDDTLPDETRWYILGDAAFVLPRDYRLEFDIQAVSDEAYLVDYDYSDNDRLRTEARIYKVDRDKLFRASLTDYTTLRDEEIAIRDRLPSGVSDIVFERRRGLAGGELRLGVESTAIYRESGLDREGRDSAEVSLSADWMRRDILPSGLVAENRARASTAIYGVADDRAFDDPFRATGTLSTALSLPLQRTGAGGMHHMIEPKIQLAWSDVTGEAVPNEDSLLVDFDEGNLFALTRFPGDDATETGLRANLGVTYTGYDPDGAGIGLTFGRVIRTEDPDLFASGTGLDGVRSDWLVAARLSFGESLDLTARSIVGGGLDTKKSEARIAYATDRMSLEGSYVWLDGEPQENRFRDTHELIVDGDLRLSRHWLGSFEAQYDFNQDRAAEAGLGLTYRTECIEIELTLSRRFTETETIDPATNFGFEVSLAGFGRGRYDDSYRKICRG